MTNSEIVATGQPGRPSKYSEALIERLLAALASGLTQKRACKAVGIGQTTLIDWLEEYPELDPQMSPLARLPRQTALEGIKTAGEKDWRALAEWLKLTFPEYRSGSNINVSATAMNDSRTVVVTEEDRKRLQAKLKELQDSSGQE